MTEFDKILNSFEKAIEDLEEQNVTIHKVQEIVTSFLEVLKEKDTIHNYEFIGDELFVWPVKAEEKIILKVVIIQGNE